MGVLWLGMPLAAVCKLLWKNGRILNRLLPWGRTQRFGINTGLSLKFEPFMERTLQRDFKVWVAIRISIDLFKRRVNFSFVYKVLLFGN